MKLRLSALAATVALLTPLAASAAFDMPSDLYTAIQGEGSAHSFSLTSHGGSNGTYLSIWANGNEQATVTGDTQLTMNATVDVANDGMKARLKGQMMIVDSMLYLKVTSVTGNQKGALAPLAALVNEKRWIAMPADDNMLADVTGTDVGVLSTTSPAKADAMFRMNWATPKKN